MIIASLRCGVFFFQAIVVGACLFLLHDKLFAVADVYAFSQL